MSQRAGWVLAGGRSSRMGVNKALIEIDGRALVAQAADAVGAACDSVSIVGDPGLYAELGLPVVPDNFPGLGPLAGIEAALSATACDWNLIVACDMPLLNREVFALLFDEIAGENVDCAMPLLPDGSVEPLCSVFHRRCIEEVRAALKAVRLRVNGAVSAIRYVRVERADPFANLNTPEDLRQYGAGRSRNG